jgi:hypothetical protein
MRDDSRVSNEWGVKEGERMLDHPLPRQATREISLLL